MEVYPATGRRSSRRFLTGNPKSQTPTLKSAFTLVELLVVITIIGILIALLLPAVQAAREAARQTQCRNNLKQLALGCLNHEQAIGRFPTNGWGFAWTGDADRGTDWRQPGGWIYNVLPYIEQQPLHDMGVGLPWNDTNKMQPNLQRLATPLSVYTCPSRRAAAVWPWEQATGEKIAQVVNAGTPILAARSDYAANGGDYYTDIGSAVAYAPTPVWSSAPPNTEAGPANVTGVENPPGQMTAAARNVFTYIAKLATGMMYCGKPDQDGGHHATARATRISWARSTSTPTGTPPARTQATTKTP